MSDYLAPQTDPKAEREAGLRRRDLVALILLAMVAAAMIVVALIAGGGADTPD